MTTELVEAARAGDRSALERLLAEHIDRVHALCRRMTGNDADADDATQEALLAIVRGLTRFDGRSAFSTWVYRVTTNVCLDELRRKRRRPEPQETLGEGPSTAPDISGAVSAAVDIDGALRQLPLDYRAAVVLRDLCGLDYAEIATVLDIPAGTVRSRIARGRGSLASLLAGNPLGAADRPTERT